MKKYNKVNMIDNNKIFIKWFNLSPIIKNSITKKVPRKKFSPKFKFVKFKPWRTDIIFQMDVTQSKNVDDTIKKIIEDLNLICFLSD